jgi:hypothetical protein
MIALPRAARVLWGINGWQTVADGVTQGTGLGLHGFEFDASSSSRARSIDSARAASHISAANEITTHAAAAQVGNQHSVATLQV